MWLSMLFYRANGVGRYIGGIIAAGVTLGTFKIPSG